MSQQPHLRRALTLWNLIFIGMVIPIFTIQDSIK